MGLKSNAIQRFKIKNDTYILGSVPLMDVSQKLNGQIWVIKNFTSHYQAAFHQVLTLSGLFLLVSTLVFIVFYAVFNRLEKEKTKLQNQMFNTAKLASLGTLGSGIAHELNNPLTIIHGNAFQIAKSCKNPDKFKADRIEKKAQKLLLHANRMKKLISFFKDFCFQDIEAEIEEVNISALIGDAFTVINRRLKKHQIELNLKFDDDLPSVQITKNPVGLLIQNILINALEAILRSDNRPGHLNVKAFTKSSQLWIQFEDNGDGIPPENLDRIFEPFYSTKEVGDGMGMGLSLAKQLMGDHHGEININSTLGKGTVIILQFPLNRPKETLKS